MQTKKYEQAGKELTLYLTEDENSPLIVYNNFEGDGHTMVEAIQKQRAEGFNLLCVGNLNWDHDMAPWNCPPLYPKEPPMTGGADDYLDLLLREILPGAKEQIKGEAPFLGIAGYSLAGLFAVYTMYRTDVFARVASMSGSLWFPDFKEYGMEKEIKRRPDKLYLSLGDKEAKTRNKLLCSVQENTEALAGHYRGLGMDVIWEMNPGNHFREAELRSAKGILAILRES